MNLAPRARKQNYRAKITCLPFLGGQQVTRTANVENPAPDYHTKTISLPSCLMNFRATSLGKTTKATTNSKESVTTSMSTIIVWFTSFHVGGSGDSSLQSNVLWSHGSLPRNHKSMRCQLREIEKVVKTLRWSEIESEGVIAISISGDANHHQ